MYYYYVNENGEIVEVINLRDSNDTCYSYIIENNTLSRLDSDGLVVGEFTAYPSREILETILKNP